MVDEAGRKRLIISVTSTDAGDEESWTSWQNDNGVTITRYEDMDARFLQECCFRRSWVGIRKSWRIRATGMQPDLIAVFTEKSDSSIGADSVEDH